jgi:hypothetical protein
VKGRCSVVTIVRSLLSVACALAVLGAGVKGFETYTGLGWGWGLAAILTLGVASRLLVPGRSR